MPDGNVKSEIPSDSTSLEIIVTSSPEIGEVAVWQTPMEFYDGKWHMKIHIAKVGEHVRVVAPEHDF